MTDRIELEGLEKTVRAFADSRDWAQFHDPKNLAMAIASEAGELCALLRWITSDDSDSAAGAEPLRSALLSEVGDIGVLLLLLCQRVGTHFDAVVMDKVAVNELKYPIGASKGRAERPSA